jgi:molybdopterin adenylyltransferase
MDQPGNNAQLTAHVLVCSDRASSLQYEDKAGPAAHEWLTRQGFLVSGITVIPDSEAQLANLVSQLCSSEDVIIISGGTGLSARDITPQVLARHCDYEVPGIGEHLRRESLKFSPNALLSRGGAWAKNGRLIFALPGNPKAVIEQLEILGTLVQDSVTSAKGLCAHRGHRSPK